MRDPTIMIMQPVDVQVFKPYFSISHIDVKFMGKYMIKSEYLAQSSSSLSISLSILSIILRFVLNEPCINPVAADDKKYANNTTHRYLYKIRVGASFSFNFTSMSYCASLWIEVPLTIV